MVGCSKWPDGPKPKEEPRGMILWGMTAKDGLADIDNALGGGGYQSYVFEMPNGTLTWVKRKEPIKKTTFDKDGYQQVGAIRFK